MTRVPRWSATATYRSKNGDLDVEHQFEELDELHGLIELGPDWGCLIDIRITLARGRNDRLTVEDAALL